MAKNGGLAGWHTRDLVDLLKTGQSANAVAFGPMAEVVVKSTQYFDDDDVQAIAVYLQSLPARQKVDAPATLVAGKPVLEQGAKIYAAQCASCHGKGGNGVRGIYRR